MKNKSDNELLSRREFFKRTVQKTLPFMAAMSIPSFLLSCGGDDPISNSEGCTDCTNSCLDACSKVCMDSCENGNNNSSGCSDCSHNCEGGCKEACANECKGESENTGGSSEEEKYTAVDLGLGVLWATFNVGAEKAEDFGGYYGWADPTGTNTSTDLDDYPSANPPSNICGTRYDIATAQWGDGWRLPSQNEAKELLNKCKWKFVTVNGVPGQQVTGTNGRSIFLPCAGSYSSEGKLWNEGKAGDYWTGTLDTEVTYDIHGNPLPLRAAFILNFGASNGKGTANNSKFRNSRTVVRPVKDGGSGCSDCSSGCSSGCADTCDRECTKKCASSCTLSCGEDCTGGCVRGCYTECEGDCQQGCVEGCFNECAGYCRYQCGTGCTAVAGR